MFLKSDLCFICTLKHYEFIMENSYKLLSNVKENFLKDIGGSEVD